MLQTMRSSAKFVFWILLLAFAGVFLFTQASGLIGRSAVTPTTAVASVNGTEILYTDWQRRSSQLVQQEQQQSGRSLTQDEIKRIDNQAFDDMVAEILLQQEYRKRGIVVSNEELRDYARFAPRPICRPRAASIRPSISDCSRARRPGNRDCWWSSSGTTAARSRRRSCSSR